MKMFRAALVSALMLVSAPLAMADTFASAAHRFSATFPGVVQQAADQNNATDATGKVISRLTSFQDSAPGRYIALVMADTYLEPVTVDQVAYLSKHVREFAEGLKVTAAQSNTTVDGNPAIQFSFDLLNQGPGKGFAVFVPGEKPRGYMVVGLRLSQGTPDDQAKLDAFLNSFDIK